MSIAKKIAAIKAELPEGVELVAVSKMHPAEDVAQAYGAGQRTFGESRVQELLAKYEALPKDIEWHLIGHLQTNKVRLIVPFVKLIHSVDSEHLLEEIENQAAKIGRTIRVLLEVHIAAEESKSGWNTAELLLYMNSHKYLQFRHIEFGGLMTIATQTDDEATLRADFERARQLFLQIRAEHPTLPFDILSMGMTGDWRIAVECGSTMVRIGSAIFGDR